MRKIVRAKGMVCGLLTIATLGAACLAPGASAAPKECEDNFIFANQLLENAQPDYADAIQTYKQVLQQCPTFDKADLVDQNLAYAYLKLKQVDNAVRVLEDATQRFPNSTHIVDLQTALGTAYFTIAEEQSKTNPNAAKSTYQKAAAVLQRIVARTTDPKLKSQLLFNIGNAEFNSGDFAGSARSYQSLMATNPAAGVAAPALYNLGNAELNLANNTPDSGAKSQAYDQAAGAFQNLVTRFPNDPNTTDAKLQLAKVRFQQKQYEQAIPLFRQLSSNPNRAVSSEATNGLAYSYIESKQYAEALPLLRQYAQANPGTTEADKNNVQIGYILRTQQKDMAGALNAYRAAANSKDPATAQLAQEGEIAVAVADFKANQFDQALPIYQSLMQSPNPKVREDAIYGRAITLTNLKDPRAQQALADYMRSYPNSPGTANAGYQLGVLQYAAKDYAGAASSFARAAQTAQVLGPQATAQDRKDADDLRREALYWAGESYNQTKQPTEAVNFWRQAVQADPNYTADTTADALVGLGQYYSSQGQDQQAGTYFQQALDHFPKSPATTDALLNLASQAAKNKQYDRAIRLYTQVARAQPNTDTGGTAQFDIGVAYLAMTPPQPAQALQAFQTYQTNFPNGKLTSRAALYMAEAYEAQANAGGGDKNANLTKALAAYRQTANAAKDADEAAHAMWKVGMIEGQLGQTEPAIRDLDSAIARYPTSKDLDRMYFEKGQIYLTAKQNEPALRAFREYLAKYPTGRDAQAAHFNAAVIQYNTAATELDNASKETNEARQSTMMAQAKSDYTRAASDFEAAVAGNPKGIPLDKAYYFEGWAYANSDQPAKAAAAFKTVVNTFPNSPDAATAGGRLGILEAQTNPDESINYLRRYLASNPKDTDAIDANLALGEAYETKGDCTNAMTTLQKVVDATNNEPAAAALYYQAKCYQRQGNNSQARLTYLKIKTLYKAATKEVGMADQELQRMGATASNAQ